MFKVFYFLLLFRAFVFPNTLENSRRPAFHEQFESYWHCHVLVKWDLKSIYILDITKT